MKKTTRLIPNLILATLLSSCFTEPPFVPNFPVGEVEGYRPVYGAHDLASIKFTDPRPVVRPGKIYVVANYLLINERHEGVHVFDNTNPSAPVAVGFLQISGNTEVAVKDNILYADHHNDLVALNVTNLNDIRELSRYKQDHWVSEVPPGTGRYFECIDPAKGSLVGWELAVLKNPKCFR